MFLEILVTDYISCYSKLTSDQITKLSTDLVDINFLENCPNGTIIGIFINQKSDMQKRVFYPFFSHINMPIKPGERAWAFSQGQGRVPYWVTRKVQNTSANDPNFTNDDSARLYSGLGTQENKRNIVSGIFYDSKASADSLSKIRSDSISYQDDFVGEPAAYVEGNCNDVVIQGSNNTAIKIGNLGSSGTGTIDIIAGLGNLSLQTTVTNTEGYNEILKPPLATDPAVSSFGTLSSGDESRITISRSFNADEYYSLTGDDSGSQKSITLKTDSVRIIAQNDLKIVVGTSSDPSSIILKNDGNIIITPSSTGVIKLGGEDATGAILATVDSIVTSGRVEATSLVSTAGGLLGAPNLPATGIFSTKVLVKVT